MKKRRTRRTWKPAEVRLLRRLFARGNTAALAKKLQCSVCRVRTKARQLGLKKLTRRYWTAAEEAALRKLYPDTAMPTLQRRFKRASGQIYAKANALGLCRSEAFMEKLLQHLSTKLHESGKSHRYPKGHVPANKGLRRPGWHAGRMRETQFRKGQLPHNSDLDFYVIGALRVNTDGYIDMRVSFEAGGKGWRGLHRILWEDRHGPIPAGHILVFRDGDRLNVELDNLELITQADNMRRNSIHHLPKPLVEVIQLKGAIKRQITKRARAQPQRESNGKRHQRAAGSPVRNAAGAA